MSRVTESTIVRHPRTGVVTVLTQGSEVPSWAKGLVGKHLLEGVHSESREASKSGPKSTPKAVKETAPEDK